MTEKIITKEKLREYINLNTTEKFIFTCGCFDIIHKGHIKYLEQAKNLGTKLIIALNSDKSVKKLKGEDRPIFNENDRAIHLAAFYFVDFIVIFDDDRPDDLLDYLKPSIHVKGGDYKIEQIPERKVVYNYGGEVVVLPVESGYSTTNIINTIMKQHN